jgi:hypothetical protein
MNCRTLETQTIFRQSLAVSYWFVISKWSGADAGPVGAHMSHPDSRPVTFAPCPDQIFFFSDGPRGHFSSSPLIVAPHSCKWPSPPHRRRVQYISRWATHIWTCWRNADEKRTAPSSLKKRKLFFFWGVRFHLHRKKRKGKKRSYNLIWNCWMNWKNLGLA